MEALEWEDLKVQNRVIEALRGLGLKCVIKVGKDDEMCVGAAVETFSDAARYHDVDLDKILNTVNRLNLPPKPQPGKE